MLNLILPAVANMLKGMVLDKAQSLASEHLENILTSFLKKLKKHWMALSMMMLATLTNPSWIWSRDNLSYADH